MSPLKLYLDSGISYHNPSTTKGGAIISHYTKAIAPPNKLRAREHLQPMTD